MGKTGALASCWQCHQPVKQTAKLPMVDQPARLATSLFELAGFVSLTQTQPIPACQLYGQAKHARLKKLTGLQAVPALSSARSFRALCRVRYSCSKPAISLEELQSMRMASRMHLRTLQGECNLDHLTCWPSSSLSPAYPFRESRHALSVGIEAHAAGGALQLVLTAHPWTTAPQ